MGLDLSLTAVELACLAVGASLVGFAKTAVSGLGAIAVVVFATVLPARESTGSLLPLLLVGDVLAVSLYRRHADVRTLLRLLPGVLPGLVLGWWFMGHVDETILRRTIGAILLVMTATQLWQRRGAGPLMASARPRVAVTLGMGGTAGFATMTANAAGPVTTLYLIRAGLPKMEMLGTAAWFYLLVNLAKLPFSASLGLVTPASLLVDAALVPALLLGGWAGTVLIRRIDQQTFELAALLLAGASATLLLL